MPPKKKKTTKAAAKAGGKTTKSSGISGVAPPAKKAKTAVGGGTVKDASDPLTLQPLFEGDEGGWYEKLKPVLELDIAQAQRFIGPDRDKAVVPIRELTFQALKPNAPEDWQVVIFGQNPYPRVESATGIAMLDNTFQDWQDKRFGSVTSMRCIIKAACRWKYGIEKSTPVAEMRKLLKKNKIVDPHGWFQAALAQGCLLLNASLTAEGAPTKTEHKNFWKTAVVAIIQEILKAKNATGRGVVFAWWGSHAKALRKLVEKMEDQYPNAKIAHVDHCNPAAMGDAFCIGNHFGDLNDALADVGESEIDWLPEKGWDESSSSTSSSTNTATTTATTATTTATSTTAIAAAPSLTESSAVSGGMKKRTSKEQKRITKMGAFVSSTIELHKMFLERLKDLQNEGQEELPPISGVAEQPLLSLEAIKDAVTGKTIPTWPFASAISFAESFDMKRAPKGMTRDDVAALHLYTLGGPFYRCLNAALRNKNRAQAKVYYTFLRLFFNALDRLEQASISLYRGVGLDLRNQYKKGSVVTWWGVSSCTIAEGVARGFLGKKGMLFHIKPRSAVSIRTFSAYQHEDEYIIRPGTQLAVESVRTSGSITHVTLAEADKDPLVT